MTQTRKFKNHNRRETHQYDDDDEDISRSLSESQSSSSFHSIEEDEIEESAVDSKKVQRYFERFDSYINVAPLPIFHGDSGQCPFTHLSRFVKVCRANNVSSVDAMVRIFPVTLEKEAAIWYDVNIEPYRASLSWEEIKSSFLDAYYYKTQLADLELTTLHQHEDELIRSYFLRLQWMLTKWPDNHIPEDLLKEVFTDGLLKLYQDWVVSRYPESLEEALKLAFEYERMHGTVVKEVKCGFCDGQHEERECKIRERMREMWRKNKDKSSEVNVKRNEEEREGLSERGERQCPCSNHNCWKKQLNRSISLVNRKSAAL